MKNLVVIFAYCLLSVSAFGQVAGERTPASAEKPSAVQISEENRYRIGFQDVLDIDVFHHPDLNQKVAVGIAGTIALFRLDHPIVAVCKTERELAVDIANAYKEKYLKDPQVSVRIAEQKSQSYAVIGAVEKPGSFYVSRRIHLLELLALAGGPSKESGTRILVARTGSTSNCREEISSKDDAIAVMDFKIRDVEEGKQSLWMKPGDVVSVQAADIVYMYGNLVKPGALKIRDPITLTQAIASAEGLKSTAAKDKIRILRQIPGKPERDEFVYDLGKIDKGKVKDPYLEPNDIVAVSQDTTKTILFGIGSTLKAAVPSAIYAIP